MSFHFWQPMVRPGRTRSSFRSRTQRSKPSRRLRLEWLEPRAMLSAVASTSSEDTTAAVVAKIVNGTATSDWEAVGKIGSSSEGYYGSGVLIGSRYVLTAGHCAYYPDDGLDVGDTEGIFYINGKQYTTSQVIVYDGWNPNELGTDDANDLAIFVLNEDVTGVTPSEIYTGTPDVGDTVTLVGYGYSGTGRRGYVTGTYGTKREGTTTIDYVTETLIGWYYDRGSSESNTAPGDSGGPAYIYENGAYYVAGICSCGTGNSGYGTYSYDTRVDAYASWIESIVADETSTRPTVSITATDATASETLSGAAANTGLFTITRTGSTDAALTIYYTVSGTAANGSDYTSIASPVTIAAGNSSATVSITPTDDALVESTETVKLALTSNSAYSVSSTLASATVSIVDNDTRPTVSIAATDATAAETAAGATANTGLFTITRTGSTAADLTVAYTLSGTATNGTDYTTIAKTATIAAGSSSTTIVVAPTDDAAYESTETVIVTLASSSSYTVSSSQKTATVSITDNDVSTAPANDNFANRISISTGTVTGSNVNATRESGEPYNANVTGGKSVWWTWTATVSGQVTISTAGSSFDTTLGVYTGARVSSLKKVAANDDANSRAGIRTSQVTFNAVAGQTYQISVDGYRGVSGSIKLSLTQTTTSAARNAAAYATSSTPSWRRTAAADAIFGSLAQLATLY